MLRTPKRKSTVAVLAAVAYVTVLIFKWHSYLIEASGKEKFADLAALKIYPLIILWLIGLPLVGFVLWGALKTYPGRVSLFSFNSGRPYWSLVWSILFAFPIFQYTFFCIASISRGELIDVAHACAMTYLLMCLRSSIVFGVSKT